MDKYKTFMLHSKAYTHNVGEITEICKNGVWGGGRGVIVVEWYAKLVHSLLEENWDIWGFLPEVREGVMEKMTARWFMEYYVPKAMMDYDLRHPNEADSN